MSCQANLGPIETQYTFLGYIPAYIPGISCSSTTSAGGPSAGGSPWPNTDCSSFINSCKAPCNKIKVKTKIQCCHTWSTVLLNCQFSCSTSYMVATYTCVPVEPPPIECFPTTTPPLPQDCEDSGGIPA